jgi:hypothetical protein
MVGMSSIAPRRTCPECKRSIAVVGGRFARHDPRNRGPVLLSCHGSLQPAPILDEPCPAGTPSLFELLDELAESQDPEDAADARALFALPVDSSLAGSTTA